MSTLGLEIAETVLPKKFVRGQDLEFVMELPCDVPKDYFGSNVSGPPAVTVTTSLTAELRRLQNAGADGFIADLNPTWEVDTNYTKIRFHVADTSAWPIGPAEFDVVFTRETVTVPPGTIVNKTFRSPPVQIEIVDGVTQ